VIKTVNMLIKQKYEHIALLKMLKLSYYRPVLKTRFIKLMRAQNMHRYTITGEEEVKNDAT